MLMRNVQKTFLVLLYLFTFSMVQAEENNTANPLIEGLVFDRESHEPLIGATLYVLEKKRGTATDIDGNFAFKLPQGTYSLRISYIGYKDKEMRLEVKGDMQLKIALEKDSKTIEDVVVNADRTDVNLTRTEMGVEKMEIQTIREVPALVGEVDIIKTIQLLPGVQATSEGSSGFSVRGGNFDQNLVLFDQATVYNAGHFLGFFSVFNNDAVDNLELYKGNIPVAYGGRLSSLLDVEMKEADLQQFHATGGLGLISSRITLEAPVIHNRTSVLVSARRTYADMFFPLSSQDAVKEASLYFWDLNGKIFHRINDKSTLTFSGYLGKDVLGQENAMDISYGNAAASLIYTYAHSERFGTKVIGTYSRYFNLLEMGITDEASFDWFANIQDYGLKVDNTFLWNSQNKIKFGISSIYHKINPLSFISGSSESSFRDVDFDFKKSLESGVYLSNEQKVGDKLVLNYGLRFSLFNNVGSEKVFVYDDNYDLADSIQYGSAEVFNTYYGLEPRISAVYRINEASSVKASYARTMQYLQMAANSTGGTPFDIWISSNPNVKPQIADQVSVGYFRNFMENHIETSIELFYKDMQNTVDFRDHAQIYMNEYLDGELRFGTSRAYGAEFMVRLNLEKLSGWVSYTLSRAERDIEGVNDNQVYAAPYDKTHDISTVLIYKWNKRLSVSATWLYATGNPITIPVGTYWSHNTQIPLYPNRNGYRMPAYHRMDVGLTLQNKKNEQRRWKGEWNISVYNVYNRHNAYSIDFVESEENAGQLNAEKTYLFPMIPSITYNFKF